MKKLLLLFMCTFLIVPQIFAQSSVWKISKGKNTLYIGGGIYTLRANDLPPPKEFDIAYNSSSILILEVDLDSQSEQKIVSLSVLPNNNTLNTILSPSIYEQLENKCAEIELPRQALSSFKPFIAMSILEILRLSEIGFLAYGIDAYYKDIAIQDAKTIDFLETFEYQMSMLNIDKKYADEFISKSLEDFDANIAQNVTVAIVKEWKKGIFKAAKNELKRVKQRFPYIYKPLILDRNRVLLGKIEKYLNTEDTEFIIIDLLNLVGDDGLLELLKKRGYGIEQL